MPHIMIIMFPEPVKNGGFGAKARKQVPLPPACSTYQNTMGPKPFWFRISIVIGILEVK